MNDLNMIAGKRKLTKSELTKVLKFTGDYKRLMEYYFLLGLSVVFIAANVAFLLRAFTSDNSAFTFISGFIFSISIFINARNVKAFYSRVCYLFDEYDACYVATCYNTNTYGIVNFPGEEYCSVVYGTLLDEYGNVFDRVAFRVDRNDVCYIELNTTELSLFNLPDGRFLAMR